MTIKVKFSHELWCAILHLYTLEVKVREDSLTAILLSDVLFQKEACDKSVLELIKQKFESSGDEYLQSLLHEIDSHCYRDIFN